MGFLQEESPVQHSLNLDEDDLQSSGADDLK
jgi:hypothetical protein